MSTNIPTESVTGQQGWEWNRMQADRRAQGRSANRSTAHAGELARTGGRRGDKASTDLEELRSELERKEQRLRYVITHYEQLLTEKNRQLENRRETESEDSGLATILSSMLPGE